jgi:hypothetical protein
MAIAGSGWELNVVRQGIHKSGRRTRTYSTYQVYRDGSAVTELAGNMCECKGPGDNDHAGSGLRIEAGRYPLWTQFGRYRTIGYSTNTQTPGDPPMPGLLLQGTGNRVGILIHPAHPPSLFLSSIGCFNPTNALATMESMNFWDSRARVIALIDDLRKYDPHAFAHEAMTRIDNAWVVVDGEPMRELTAAPRRAEAVFAAMEALPQSLPLSKEGAVTATKWLLKNFGAKLKAATKGKPYKVKHLCAIVCQETAYKWLKWIENYDPATILARCVFDASGDYPGSPRSAFPKNTAEFRRKFGSEFTDMLIAEANLTRRVQGWGDKPWVYKGYGIFQYDLQNVLEDEDFFRQKKWTSFDECLSRCTGELDDKLKATGGELWQAIKAYNGRGPRAETYMNNVKAFTEYCAEVTGE